MTDMVVHRSRGYLNTEGLKLVIEDGLPEEATDRDIAMQVRVALERHYPDPPWSVTSSCQRTNWATPRASSRAR